MKFRDFLNEGIDFKAVHKAVEKLGASVASSAKGRIIPGVSRIGNETIFNYTDDKGKRHEVYKTDKKVSKEDEEKIIADIRAKFSK
jgi:hypothetical protein